MGCWDDLSQEVVGHQRDNDLLVLQQKLVVRERNGDVRRMESVVCFGVRELVDAKELLEQDLGYQDDVDAGGEQNLVVDKEQVDQDVGLQKVRIDSRNFVVDGGQVVVD